jgi:hypothetical protein
VKPYVKSQKNDANDAEAICEAVSNTNPTGREMIRPDFLPVTVKLISRDPERRFHRASLLIAMFNPSSE